MMIDIGNGDLTAIQKRILLIQSVISIFVFAIVPDLSYLGTTIFILLCLKHFFHRLGEPCPIFGCPTEVGLFLCLESLFQSAVLRLFFFISSIFSQRIFGESLLLCWCYQSIWGIYHYAKVLFLSLFASYPGVSICLILCCCLLVLFFITAIIERVESCFGSQSLGFIILLVNLKANHSKISAIAMILYIMQSNHGKIAKTFMVLIWLCLYIIVPPLPLSFFTCIILIALMVNRYILPAFYRLFFSPDMNFLYSSVYIATIGMIFVFGIVWYFSNLGFQATIEPDIVQTFNDIVLGFSQEASQFSERSCLTLDLSFRPNDSWFTLKKYAIYTYSGPVVTEFLQDLLSWTDQCKQPISAFLLAGFPYFAVTITIMISFITIKRDWNSLGWEDMFSSYVVLLTPLFSVLALITMRLYSDPQDIPILLKISLLISSIGPIGFIIDIIMILCYTIIVLIEISVRICFVLLVIYAMVCLAFIALGILGFIMAFIVTAFNLFLPLFILWLLNHLWNACTGRSEIYITLVDDLFDGIRDLYLRYCRNYRFNWR